ncbi:hypothetical protein DTO271G3_47 [Paecilomyces variotii]|nr:hypothetical protein DTO271G3_47 [Paecilomyces variotii]
MSHTALVTGATGLLGRQVFNIFKHAGWLTVGQGHTRAVPPTIMKANLENPEEARMLLDEAKPLVVVHCAANRSPDLCENDPERASKINVQATRALAQATSSRGIFLIYISTDYVFPGRPGEAPYETSAKPEPTNRYGQMKRDGEVAVLEETSENGMGVVLRVPVLYGSAQKNEESAVNVLVDAVWKAQDENAGVKMDDWAQRYPTNTEDVARVCLHTAVKYLSNRNKLKEMPRILHFTSEDRMTKYEMCEKFAEILNLPLPGMIRNKEGNDPNAPVQRPYDTHLSTKELKDLEIDTRTVDFVAWWRRELGAYRK